jgi:BirA family biotin operon repressor/biotin-[acetyl-CoA-carboxylase] ligase
MASPLPKAQHYCSALVNCQLARHIYFFDEMDSTSTWSKKLIERTRGDGGLHGTIVIANYQRAGRGRFERKWEAPAGLALLFSVIINISGANPDLDAEIEKPGPDFFRTAAAVALCRAIRQYTGLAAQIKYPNDIVFDGRKAAGVLIETLRVGGNHFAVIGIGVNANQAQTDLPSDARITPSSLRLESGREWNLPALLAAIVNELQTCISEYSHLENTRHMALLCATIGQFVQVDMESATCQGLAIGISNDGALIVRGDSGIQQLIYSGDVKQLAANR